MTQQKRALVLGGGIAGLAAAQRLHQRGIQTQIIERNPALGGLTRSIYVDRYVFDYTGHFLHLAKATHPNELASGISGKGEWVKLAKKSYCYAEGKYIQAPFQYNLGDLSEATRKACVESYQEALLRAKQEDQKPNDLLNYFYSSFGTAITDLFLKPYNEKILAVDLREVNAISINRFFPKPDEKLILEGAKPKNHAGSAQGYNALFWYPKKNGIQQLVDSMSLGLSSFVGEVSQIDLDARSVSTTAGDKFSYDYAFSSIPLDDTLGFLKGSPYTTEQKSLSCASVLAWQIGVNGPLPKVLEDKHWVYVADPNIPFHRVGIYSNFNDTMAPRGCYNLYVEVGARQPITTNINQMQNSILNILYELGWVDPNQLDVCLVHPIKHGYVHFNHAWSNTVPSMLSTLEQQSFYPIGRYGRWNYISMEDGILGAKEIVERAILSDGVAR